MNQAIPLTKILTLNNLLKNANLIIVSLILLSCSGPGTNYTEMKREPMISPDYSGITIPPNIAPLNFKINEKADNYLAKLHPAKGNVISVSSTNGNIIISPGKWKIGRAHV
jgi:hypothetical protein